MTKPGCVYILTNQRKTVLYIGVTSDIQKRMCQHISGVGAHFTRKYKLKSLIYFEQFDDIQLAIQREKFLKGKTRRKKEELINNANPQWLDLSTTIL